jgi:WhiB family redox-sensing transcriptional regulator
MTERERRALLKRNPNAKWRAVLEQARTGAISPAVKATV